MKTGKIKWLPLLLMIALLTQGCSMLPFGKKEEQEITIKIVSDNSLMNLESIFKEKFPHITFEVKSPIREAVKKNLAPDKWDEDIAEMIA